MPSANKHSGVKCSLLPSVILSKLPTYQTTLVELFLYVIFTHVMRNELNKALNIHAQYLLNNFLLQNDLSIDPFFIFFLSDFAIHRVRGCLLWNPLSNQ